MAAVAVFSSLILSNLAVLLSAQALAADAASADLERTLSAQGGVLNASAAVALLGRIEEAAAERPYDCSNATAELAAVVAQQSVTVSAPGVSATASGSEASGTAAVGDPATAPYGGWKEGSLNVWATSRSSSTAADGGVGYSLMAGYALSLPFSPAALASLCLFGSARLEDALASAVQACNRTSFGLSLGDEMKALRADASALGYEVGASEAGWDGCSDAVTLSYSQSSIAGPMGPFTWTAAQVVGPASSGP